MSTWLIAARQLSHVSRLQPLLRNMASSNTPPTFDKSIFAKEQTVCALSVPNRSTDGAVKALRNLLIDIPKIKPVQKLDTDPNHRFLLLKPEVADGACTVADTHKASISSAASSFPHTDQCCQRTPDATTQADHSMPHLVPWKLTLGYENMSTDSVLRTLLPSSIEEIPSSFEGVGHLAHLNLKEEQLPYKHIIGQVLLDKNATIRTVVNKVASIETKFRTFPMEIIAGYDGPDATQVEMKHCGAIFKFDFRTVYWNSRLQKEHEHMVHNVVPAGSLVADVFCGVGPFSIPAASSSERGGQGCTVHANDLNPHSYAALCENVKRNKVAQAITCYNLDGRAFILTLGSAGLPFEHALMNLPADGLEFLDAFVGLWKHPKKQVQGEGSESTSSSASSAVQTYKPRPLPVIHCYCFSKAEAEAQCADDVTLRTLKALHMSPPSAEQAHAAADARKGGDPTGTGAGGPGGIDSPYVRAVRDLGLLSDLTVRNVRDVAPKKLMLCVSFTLTKTLAEAQPVVTWDSLAEADRAEAEGDCSVTAQAAKRARHE